MLDVFTKRKIGTRHIFSALLSGLFVLMLGLTALPINAKADQATIDAGLIARMRNVISQLAPTTGTTWEQYLNKRFYFATKLDMAGASLSWSTSNSVPGGWKWSGAAAALPAPTAIGKPTSPRQIPFFDTGSNTFYVYSADQLRYALVSLSGSAMITRSISIQEDIDLNGQAGNVWACINELRHVNILGNGHTIYNLRVDDSRESRTTPNANPNDYAAMIGLGYALNMQDLTFSYANICGDYYYVESKMDGSYRHSAGIIGWLSTTTTGGSTVMNVTLENMLVVGGAQVSALSGRTSTTSAGKLNLRNCYAENNICFGEQHVSSLASSVNNLESAEYCYSIGSIVISTAGHSGGLFSCGGGVGRIANCFVDAEVYGNKQTGVFAGAMSGIDNAGTIYDNCFASGYVEGVEAMGGFIGDLVTSNMTITNCYSTALVGLRSGAMDVGGFLGRRSDTSGSIQNMANCYAAGETGYTGLDCSATATTPSASAIGGFIGRMPNRLAAASNCYYDKQATAMREWGAGSYTSTRLLLAGWLDGVLTKNSVLVGSGLTSTAPGATGFRGFSSDQWDYSAEDHYPELKAFKFATAANWGTQARANLVKAYSLASTATVKLDLWDYTLNKATGKIDVLAPGNTQVYDTVRDLTSSFTLTAKLVDSWDRIGVQDSRTHGESTSIIAGETLDVLSLKSVDGQFVCDELVPGIEWLMVTCSVGGQSATRRLRIIPTASLDAGVNTVITGLYDHADDVKLFYSTGARIENDRSDVTTGIYPDIDGQSNAISAEQRTMLDNGKNTYPESRTQIGNDLYYGASADYMGKAGENSESSELYVYIYKVTGIDDANGLIQLGDRITLTDKNMSSGASAFNGYSLLDNTDQRYLIEYMWELEDGRVLSDAKMVRRAQMPFNVSLRLYKNVLSLPNLYPEGGYLYTGINAPGGSRLPLTNFSEITVKGRQAAKDAGTAEFKQTAQTAWKLKVPADRMISLKLTMQHGDPAIQNREVFTATVDNPVAGTPIPLPCIRYRIVYKNGSFFTIPEHVTRTYVLQYDVASKVWHLEFDKAAEQSPENREIFFNDVENHIFVDVVVRHQGGDTPVPPKTGDYTPLPLWWLLCVAAGAVLVAFPIIAKKRRGACH